MFYRETLDGVVGCFGLPGYHLYIELVVIIDPEMFVDRYGEEGSIFILHYFQSYSLVKVCILIEGRVLFQYVTVLLQSIQRDSQVFEHARLVPSTIMEEFI